MYLKLRKIILDSLNFAKQEFATNYRESILGYLWIVLSPLFLMLLYVAVFGYIFEGSFGDSDNKIEYGVGIFLGLSMYSFIGESLSAAPKAVLLRSNLVEKVKFPLEIIPLTKWFISVYRCLISILIALLICLIYRGSVDPVLLLFPIVLVPLFGLTCGLYFLLSSLGVYFRDLENLSAIVSRGLFFASAIFYPLDKVPDQFKVYIELNPIAVLIDMTRSMVLWGDSPAISRLGFVYGVSFAMMGLGLFVYIKLKRGFADVL